MKLSVVIPNRNDVAMLGVTVRSCLEELKAIDNDGEIIIVDNSDEDLWSIIKQVNESPFDIGYVQTGQVRLIRQNYPGLYAARQNGCERAKGEYIYNIDSHTLIGRDHFKTLVEFMDTKKDDKIAFGYAPIGWVSKHEAFARHDLRTNEGSVFGSWGRRYYEPKKIFSNFGSYIVNRNWFLNVHKGYDFFASKRLTWGAGEWYIPVKGALLGYEAWAVPCSPQYHIGPFSQKIQTRTNYKYRVYANDGQYKRGIGIMASFYALGGEDGKQDLMKNPRAYTQYGLSIEGDWPTAVEIAKEAREDIENRQVISFKELIEKKDWTQTWSEWKPDEELNRVFDVANIEVVG